MRETLQDIYAEYSREIYRYFYGLTLDPALSEDLTSDVFLEAVKSLHTFQEGSSIKTWLFSVARHCWYHYLRKKKLSPAVSMDYPDILLAESGMEKNVSDRMLLDRIQALLQKEPPRTREIMHLRIQGFSYYEIGSKLGISENSARVIEFRTKTKIRQILKKEGFTDE